jgi:putative chitinase
MPIDRQKYFDAVRKAPFGGTLNQGQVDGNNYLLEFWEGLWEQDDPDLRPLAYVLATTKWETAHTMQPIEEYGKGSGKSYGKKDPETGQTYYGRGYVQLTWRDNYARATKELGLVEEDDLEWFAARALDPVIARQVIFEGCAAGWFTGKQLDEYFNDTTDDPKNARQIVNGNDHDKDIANIHQQFLTALKGAYSATVPPAEEQTYTVAITTAKGKQGSATVEVKKV